MTTTVEGKRIVLRPVREIDIGKAYIDWMNDKLVNRFMETRFRRQDEHTITEYVKMMNNDDNIYFMAIILKEQSLHIGNIKLHVFPHHRRGEISLFIGNKCCWGKGFATESINLISSFAFNVIKLHKVTAGCYSNNVGSAKAFEKAFFQREAVLRDHYLCEGQFVHLYCYARFSEGDLK